MKNRKEMLTLITEMRGRLDELEQLAMSAPGVAVVTPQSFDEAGVEELGGNGYAALRANGLSTPITVGTYELASGFLQVGAADAAMTTRLEAFELSELHKRDKERAYGLTVTPTGRWMKWMTYEFVLQHDSILDYRWTEWVLKLSLEKARRFTVNFWSGEQNDSGNVSCGSMGLSEFASFLHVRVTRDDLSAALAGRKARNTRLVLGFDGEAVPLNVYNFAVFGKR
ncbi:MAG: hypothetical protein AAFW46_03905 [Pseudomonadota bacterium]